MKEQKIKDTIIEDYRTKEKTIDFNNGNILFINDTNNFNDINSVNAGMLDNTNNNQYNTFYSENNTKDSYNYSSLFRKALKKKYLIKEFSHDKFNTKSNLKNKALKNEILHPQQISNKLLTKLRD